jgi:hypothetical protein
MKILTVITVCLLFGCSDLRAEEPKWITKVDRLCGYLMKERELKKKHHSTSGEFADVPVGKATVFLYLRDSKGSCCEESKPVAQLTTEKSGKFDFGKVSAGSYWVVAIIDAHTYKMGIEYSPSTKYASKCNEFLYTVDRAGIFGMKATITVT